MTTVSRKSLLRAAVYHCVLAGVTGTIVGAVDGAFRGVQLGFVGAGLVGGLLLLWGALQGVVVHLGQAVVSKTALPAMWRRATTSDRDADRQPVVRFHALLITGIGLGALIQHAFVLYLTWARNIKDEALHFDLTVICFGLGLAALLLCAPLLAVAVARPLARLDARYGLPFPKWRALRYWLYVVAPTVAALWPMFTVYGVKLGMASRLFGGVLFFVMQGGLHVLLSPVLQRLSARQSAWVLRGAVLVLGFALLGAAWRFDRSADLRTDASRRPLLPIATDVLQRASDVDRDGISALFGGSDCAPFNASLSPAARDIPGNGVDEDCDGKDATVGAGIPKLRTFYGESVGVNAQQYNVLWVVVDSLRADHLNLYGYRQATAPTLRSLGQQSLVFTEAYSQSSTTALSIPSMLAGRRPGSMTWDAGNFPSSAASETLLQELLARAGYDTTLLINNWVSTKLRGLGHGFANVRVSQNSQNWMSGHAGVRNAFLAMTQASSAGKPFFIMMHADDVHHPYVSHRGRALPRFPAKGKEGAEAKELEDYDRSIANFDNIFATLLDNIQKTSLWNNTIIIVTADHGEEFGEHGGAVHSASCYDEVVHVPLIFRVPGIRHRSVDTRVELTDIVPTLIELLGLEGRDLPLDGQSLLMPLYAPTDVNPDRPIFCSIYQLLGGRQNFFTQSVRTEEYTLIHELLSDSVELYSRAKDPLEKHNLADNPESAAQVAPLLAMLKANLTGNLFQVRRFK